jgi:hypothetical protein
MSIQLYIKNVKRRTTNAQLFDDIYHKAYYMLLLPLLLCSSKKKSSSSAMRRKVAAIPIAKVSCYVSEVYKKL